MQPYQVWPLDRAPARAYILAHHYLGSCPVAPSACYGLWERTALRGVVVCSVGSSEAARAYPFGRDYAANVLELSRFHLQDATRRNAESWLLDRVRTALARAQPRLWALVAFADPTPPAGHHGGIYQAVGALYLGRTRARRAYRATTGAIHSERQGKRTITLADAQARGWTPVPQEPKYRYLILLGSPLRRYYLGQMLRVPSLPYPAPPPRQLALPLLWDRALLAGAAGIARLDARYLGARLARHYYARLGVPAFLHLPDAPVDGGAGAGARARLPLAGRVSTPFLDQPPSPARGRCAPGITSHELPRICAPAAIGPPAAQLLGSLVSVQVQPLLGHTESRWCQ